MTRPVSMYKAILKIPVISSLVYITNTYVLRGDPAALDLSLIHI